MTLTGPTIATVTLTPVAAVAAVTVVTTEAETAVMTAEVPPIPRTTAVAAAAAPRRTTLPPPTTTPGGLRRPTTGTGAETGAGHPWVARILGTEDQEDTGISIFFHNRLFVAEEGYLGHVKSKKGVQNPSRFPLFSWFSIKLNPVAIL